MQALFDLHPTLLDSVLAILTLYPARVIKDTCEKLLSQEDSDLVSTLCSNGVRL